MRCKRNSAKIRMIIMLIIVCVLCILCLSAPYFMPNDPNHADLLNAKQPPNEEFPWGTDSLGRCVFSRVCDGAATTVFSALIIVALSLIIGCAIGIICGYFGGKLDIILMRIVDIFLAFPGMVLALAVAGMLGKGLNNAIIALIATGWCQYARLTRSYVISLKQENFICAAKLNGESSFCIMIKHVLPNALRPVIVTASLSIGGAMLSLSGLSFLGLGPQPPAAEWGNMLAEGRGLMQMAPWIVFYPGIAIFICSVIFNLMGDSVRDILDPLDSRNIFSKIKKKG